MWVSRHLLMVVMFSLFSGSAWSYGAEKQEVFLWPSKVEELGGRPTEEISPRNEGNTTRLTKIHSPSILLYPAPASDKPVPAVVVCPGGGYQILAIDKTGTEIAEWLNSIGITAMVLKYTVPGKKDEAFKDLQRAMGIVRQNAGKWNIDPSKLGVIGFSAGGNLAARLCNADGKRTYQPVDQADKLPYRPAFCLLIYPAWLDAKAISDDAPPTFIVQAKDDRYVKPTIPYAEALKEKKIPSEFHLFELGGHGFGLRPSMHPVSTEWPKLAEKWIEATITKLERQDLK